MARGLGSLEPSESLLQALGSRSEDNRGTHIFDLPLVLLSSVLARISDPVTAASVTCSCRLFRTISKSVPYRFRVSCMKLHEGAGALYEEGIQNKYSSTGVGMWTRKVLSTVRCQMPSTRVLDLSGCWIVDEDVAAVLADLRCLKCLILDGCQKLTSAVADALAVSVRSGPQAVSLQRCFGLGPAAAGNLLAAAAADGSQLQCILLSHLDRLDLPREPPLLEAKDFEISQGEDEEPVKDKPLGAVIVGPGRWVFAMESCGMLGTGITGSGIRILALHNCGSLGTPELAAVGITCPMLEFLFLGGSVEGLCLNRPENLCLEAETSAVSAVVKAVESLRHLRVLEVTFFPNSVVQGLRGHIGHGVEVWDFCEKRSVFSALTFLINAGALQDTDFFLEYRTSVKSAVADVSSRAGQEKTGSGMCTANELWGWFSEGIDAKSRFDGIDKNQGWAENCLLALRAAVNSSDLRRRTPLHTAALDGDTEMVRYLIFMGADSGLRDSAGGTALFSAAWFGYADICDLLLMSGADVLSRNRAGENPLYIAALRGHASAVEVMLSHCKANNINWQSAEVYGDGWTPLMAAAVADRQDVAKVLLQAACSDLCLDCTREECEICKKSWRGQDRESITALTFDNTEGVVLKSQECLKEGDTKDSRKKSTCTAEFSRNLSMKASPQILNAQNRYGQTALHIAARRASVWFVVNLLHVGASADIRDEYKKKPVDIANNQNHTLVADIFMQWDAQQRKGPPPGVLSHSSVISGNQVGPEQVRQGSVSSLSHWKSARKNDGIRSVQATSCAIMPLDNLKSGGSKRVWREKVKGSHQGTT